MTEKELIFKNIINRRNVKPDRYTGNTVSDEIIEQMLEAAHWAPTHGHTEPWHFVVFTGKGKNKLYAFLESWLKAEGTNEIACNKIKSRIDKASHIIGIGMKRGSNEKIPQIEELLSVGMAVQNMWLMAQANGVGAYWSSGEKAFKPKMRNFLGLSEGDLSLGFLYVGEKAVTDMPGHRLSKFTDHVIWNRD